MRIIVNADDFGLTRAVNAGIEDAFQNGIVRSTTMMVSMPAFEHAVSVAKRNTGLGVGVHLNLTAGYPVLNNLKTLTDESGQFLRLHEYPDCLQTVDTEEVRAEFVAQIEKLLSVGIQPTHLDSHHHIQAFDPIFAVFCEVAKQYHLPVRNIRNINGHYITGDYAERGIKTTEFCCTSFYGDAATFETLTANLESFQGESLEVMSHPSYLDLALHEMTSQGFQRIHELHALTRSEWKQYIKEHSIVLSNFAEL